MSELQLQSGRGLTIPSAEPEQLELVRSFLTGNLHTRVDGIGERLAALENKLGSDDKTVATMTESLPKAMTKAWEPSNRVGLIEAMTSPWVGAAGRAAEQQLPAATLALSPIMMPAISHAVKERMSAFSRALQRASPTRRIGWKIKSLQTGLPLETIIEQAMDPFRVYRILVVEMPAGNLLASYRAVQPGETKAVAHSEDESYATAALLTALRSFVRDAGIGEAYAELNSIDVGKRTLHIAQQGSLMLAVEASGQFNFDLESSIHGELFPSVRAAQGQSAKEKVLANWREHSTPVVEQKMTLNGMLIAVILAALLGAITVANRWVEQRDIAKTISRIEMLPGVTSARSQKTGSDWFITVAADPLAEIEPAFSETLTPRARIDLRVDPVLSLDNTTTARAIMKLNPPPAGTSFTLTKDSVRLLGRAPRSYIEALKQNPRVMISGLIVDTRSAVVQNEQ